MFVIFQDFPQFWPEDELQTHDDMITVEPLPMDSSSVDNLNQRYNSEDVLERKFKLTDLRVRTLPFFCFVLFCFVLENLFFLTSPYIFFVSLEILRYVIIFSPLPNEIKWSDPNDYRPTYRHILIKICALRSLASYLYSVRFRYYLLSPVFLVCWFTLLF